jgi:hypothetical protein
MVSCGACDRKGDGLFDHNILKFQCKDHETQKNLSIRIQFIAGLLNNTLKHATDSSQIFYKFT